MFSALTKAVLLASLTAVLAQPKVPTNLGCHDPSRVIYDNGGYYFWCTSNDLSGWYTLDNGNSWKGYSRIFSNGIPASVHNAVPSNDGHNIWAPDVIYNPNTGLFNLYYSVANWDDGSRSAIGLVTSPTLNPANAKWTDRGLVIAKTPTANTYNAIDPGLFFDASGNLWMVLGSGYASTKATSIQVVPLDKNTGLRSGGGTSVVMTGSDEAAYVHYRSGYYYLFWNNGGCCSGAASTYTIHVARSSSVTGGFTGSRTFFASKGSIHGPGHIGILSQSGVDYFSYHYYPDSGGSVLGLGTISWGSDGWPSVGSTSAGGGGALPTTTKAGAATTTKAGATTTKAATTAPASGGGSGSPLYGQCGGTGWTGPKTCASGTCKYSNDFYSQCLP